MPREVVAPAAARARAAAAAAANDFASEAAVVLAVSGKAGSQAAKTMPTATVEAKQAESSKSAVTNLVVTAVACSAEPPRPVTKTMPAATTVEAISAEKSTAVLVSVERAKAVPALASSAAPPRPVTKATPIRAENCELHRR